MTDQPKDYGKSMKPPADATHCGGYPVEPHPLAGAVKPDVCDGKEQYAFEAWAKAQRLDMSEHPLHYLFLNDTTNAARQAWKAAIQYCRALSSPTPPADMAGLVEREEFRNTPAEPERGGDETPYDRGYVWGYRHGLQDADATLSARVAELESLALRLTEERDRALGWRDHDKERAEKSEAHVAELEAELDAAYDTARDKEESADYWHEESRLQYHRAEAAEAALADAREGSEGIDDLPEGDVRIDIEHVHGGWCAYIFVYPQHGPIVPAERKHLYTRTPAMPTRAEAVAALPAAIRAMKGKP